MNPRIAKMIAAGGFAALLAGPALAQIPLPPLPNLEVHITNERPPAPRYERRIRRPGPDYVWVAGSYDWQDGRWAWVPGRWDRPQGRARWIGARYVRDGGGYRYEPGHWSTQRLAVGSDYREWHDRHHNDRNHDRRWDRDPDDRDNRDNRNNRNNRDNRDNH